MNQESKSKKGKDALKTIMAAEAPPPVPPIPPPACAEPPVPPRRKNPRLEHWSVLLAEADPGSLMDFKSRLRGEIFGHPNPKFTDGEISMTSPLISLDVTARIAKTKNTVYDLGEPDPTFLEYIERLHKKLEDYNFTFDPNARKVPRRL